MNQKYSTILGIVFVSLLMFYLTGLIEVGLDQEGRLGFSVLIFAGGLWVFEPIPLQVTGLIIPVSLVGTNILTVQEAFQPFASPVVFLILGSLFLAEALRKHGLTRRIALDLIVRCRGNPKLLLLAVMSVAAFVSMWIFSTAVVAMLIPVCFAIARRIGEQKRPQFITVLLMALVISSTLGALSTIIGASSNAVASGFLMDYRVWTFFDWMKYGVPLSFVFIFISWTIIIFTVYPDIESINTEVVEEELQKEGALSSEEKGIIYILSASIVFFVLGPELGRFFNLPRDLTHSAIISLIGATVLFSTEIISWQDARQVNWGIYLIIGAGLSLGEGLLASGVSQWIANFMTTAVTEMSYAYIAGTLIITTALLSNVVNNTTVVAILAPVMADAAQGMSLAPLQLMLPMAFGATFGFLLPAASSRMALIYASGEVEPQQMIKIGGIVTVPLLILTVGYFFLLFQLGLI